MPARTTSRLAGKASGQSVVDQTTVVAETTRTSTVAGARSKMQAGVATSRRMSLILLLRPWTASVARTRKLTSGDRHLPEGRTTGSAGAVVRPALSGAVG